MTLAERKLAFIEALMKVEEEKVIERLEAILLEEDMSMSKPPIIGEVELNERVAESEKDFSQGRFKDSTTLLAKYANAI